MSQQSSIRIDWTTCDKRGLCAELLPELIALDEWGFPVVQSGPIPDKLLRHARRAAAACPTLALHIVADRRP